MNTIYIDYTHSVPSGTVKFHGGANYTRTVLKKLSEYMSKNNIAKKVVILWPEHYDPISEIEKEIYEDSHFAIRKIKGRLEDEEYDNNSTIYIPLLPARELPIIKRLYRKNRNLIMTIHGLRMLDLRFDIFDLKYNDNVLINIKAFISMLLIPAKKLAYKYIINKYTKYLKTVITVSNYTLSSLAKCANVHDIRLQFEDALPITECDTMLGESLGKYILFVSGNRTEKNLARVLEAFKSYQKRCNKAIPLFIVGTNSKVRSALINNLGISDLVSSGKVIFSDYISDETLAGLYKCAYFLVYASKSEGFGLPALEAARYNCPSICAYGTSIPEILGSNSYYINPYSIESITKGMEYMSEEENNNRIRSMLYSSISDINKRSEISNNEISHLLISD